MEVNLLHGSSTFIYLGVNKILTWDDTHYQLSHAHQPFPHKFKEGSTSKLEQHKGEKKYMKLVYGCYFIHIHNKKLVALTTLWINYNNAPTQRINLMFLGGVFDLKYGEQILQAFKLYHRLTFKLQMRDNINLNKLKLWFFVCIVF
jgi:hypothetical protein